MTDSELPEGALLEDAPLERIVREGILADTILAGIAAVAREHLAYEGPVEWQTPLVEALRLDSIRLLTLVVELENRFQVVLDEGDEVGLQTVGDLVSAIATAMNRGTLANTPAKGTT